MNIYVGNLPYSATAESIREHFEPYGQVAEVRVISDRHTGRPRGFCFVTMDDAREAKAAIEWLDGTEFEGRSLRVNEARPRNGKS